jgi:hypothetical protein
MLPRLNMPNPETLAHLGALVADEEAYQRDMLQARQYDDGNQFVALTERLRQFLGGDVTNTTEDYKRLRLNLVRTVTTAVVERLIVTGFDSDEVGAIEESPTPTGEATPKTIKPVAAWATALWQQARMDATQRRVHHATLRDSESFVIVDWDVLMGRPTFTPHLRFIDGSVDGDNEGCRAFYADDDPDRALLFVSKRWTEVVFDAAGHRTQRQRMNLYYPDRIEKYKGFPGAWAEVQDPLDPSWPLRWLDKKGQPLGIPAIHFRSTAGMEAREAIGPQNAINKTIIDLMAAGDATAFRILIALGWNPVDANGDPLPIEPGRWLGTPNKDANVIVVEPADLSGLVGLVDKWIHWTAMVTDTPVSRFISTAQIAAEGTLKEQEGPLITKTRNRAGEMGDAWEDCMSMARRLANTFGGAALDEVAQLSTLWEPFQARDEDAELARAAKKQALGIPRRQILLELGYDAAQVAQWDEEATKKEDADRAAQGAAMGNGKPMFGRG